MVACSCCQHMLKESWSAPCAGTWGRGRGGTAACRCGRRAAPGGTSRRSCAPAATGLAPDSPLCRNSSGTRPAAEPLRTRTCTWGSTTPLPPARAACGVGVDVRHGAMTCARVYTAARPVLLKDSAAMIDPPYLGALASAFNAASAICCRAHACSQVHPVEWQLHLAAYCYGCPNRGRCP